MGTTNSAAHHTSRASAQPPGAEHASIVEPRPMTDSPGTPGAPSLPETLGAQEMFLSPRVLDAGAFARYSEMLKSIIAQASAQTRTLEDFSTDAQAMIQRCDETAETINKRMQAGVRMLKMIDERAARTDLLLDRVQASLPDSQSLADQIDQVIEDRLAHAQRQIDRTIAQAQAKAQEAEERAQRAIESSTEHALHLAELSAKIEGQLAELDARIESTRSQTAATLDEILERTGTISDQLNADLNQVLARTQEAGANLAAKIDEASNLTDARIAELSRSIEPVLEAAQQAMRTLGMDPENPVFEDSPLSRIESLVERGETQAASLDRVYRQLEDLQSQAEGVRSGFGCWLIDAAGELDVLEARKDKLVGPMIQAAEKIAELGPDIEEKLELASTKLTHLQLEQQTLRQAIQASSSIANEVTEQMTNQSGQLQALLDGSLHKLSTRVEQAGVWLGALIQRAESLANTLPGAGQMEFETPGNSGNASPTPSAAPSAAPSAIERSIGEPAEEQQAQAPIIEQRRPTGETSTPSTPSAPSASSAPSAKPAPPTPSLVVPEPPCLPIDAISFDGAPIAILHEPTDPS